MVHRRISRTPRPAAAPLLASAAVPPMAPGAGRWVGSRWGTILRRRHQREPAARWGSAWRRPSIPRAQTGRSPCTTHLSSRAAPLPEIPPALPTTHSRRSSTCLHAFAFSRMSQTWSRTVRGLSLRLLVLGDTRFGFLRVLPGLPSQLPAAPGPPPASPSCLRSLRTGLGPQSSPHLHSSPRGRLHSRGSKYPLYRHLPPPRVFSPARRQHVNVGQVFRTGHTWATPLAVPVTLSSWGLPHADAIRPASQTRALGPPGLSPPHPDLRAGSPTAPAAPPHSPSGHHRLTRSPSSQREASEISRAASLCCYRRSRGPVSFKVKAKTLPWPTRLWPGPTASLSSSASRTLSTASPAPPAGPEHTSIGSGSGPEGSPHPRVARLPAYRLRSLLMSLLGKGFPAVPQKT